MPYACLAHAPASHSTTRRRHMPVPLPGTYTSFSGGRSSAWNGPHSRGALKQAHSAHQPELGAAGPGKQEAFPAGRWQPGLAGRPSVSTCYSRWSRPGPGTPWALRARQASSHPHILATPTLLQQSRALFSRHAVGESTGRQAPSFGRHLQPRRGRAGV